MTRTALVVEDQPVFRRFLRLRLEQIGWSVSDAGDALQAKNIFRDAQPQLVTLDVLMPEAGGVSSLDLLRTIRAESPQTVVHVLSSVLSTKDRQLFIDEGASTFSSKPFLSAVEFEGLLVRAKALFEQLAELPHQSVGAADVRVSGPQRPQGGSILPSK